MSTPNEIGTVVWQDLTVPDAETVRDFYSAVVGWQSEAVDMGGYDDYNMLSPSGGETVAGICHARSVNSDLPAQWLIYFAVESIIRSVDECRHRGGTVIVEPRELAGQMFCVVRDPAGAVCALAGPA